MKLMLVLNIISIRKKNEKVLNRPVSYLRERTFLTLQIGNHQSSSAVVASLLVARLALYFALLVVLVKKYLQQ